MKKPLITLIALAAAGVASAQSSVTLFGIVDEAIAYGSGSISNKTQLTSNAYAGSRLGFRGTEDLGGGLSASFWLEAGIQPDSGAGTTTNTNNQANGTAGSSGLTFGRRSTVSLAGGWGEVRLGRDYTPQYWNLFFSDPFGSVGAGAAVPYTNIITGVTNTRASNSIGYFLPGNLGGFYGQIQHYLGENASGSATSKDGTGSGARLGYASGPLDVAITLSGTDYAAGNVSQNNLFASWNFGVAKLVAGYSRDRNGTLNARGYQVGGLIPVGVGQIRMSYSNYHTDAPGTPQSNKLALGYVYNLSKRTLLYATYAHLRNSGGAASALNGAVTAANASSNGYDFGIRHSF